jgi:hypothetical protein
MNGEGATALQTAIRSGERGPVSTVDCRLSTSDLNPTRSDALSTSGEALETIRRNSSRVGLFSGLKMRLVGFPTHYAELEPLGDERLGRGFDTADHESFAFPLRVPHAVLVLAEVVEDRFDLGQARVQCASSRRALRSPPPPRGPPSASARATARTCAWSRSSRRRTPPRSQRRGARARWRAHAHHNRVRGLAERTAAQHCSAASELLTFLGFDRGRTVLRRLGPQQIEAFVRTVGGRVGRAFLQHVVARLRSFPRFRSSGRPPSAVHEVPFRSRTARAPPCCRPWLDLRRTDVPRRALCRETSAAPPTRIACAGPRGEDSLQRQTWSCPRNTLKPRKLPPPDCQDRVNTVFRGVSAPLGARDRDLAPVPGAMTGASFMHATTSTSRPSALS